MEGSVKNGEGVRVHGSFSMPELAWKAIFLEEYSRTMNIAKSAQKAGVSRQTIMKYRDKDPEFALEMKMAKETATDSLEEAVLQRARDGVVSVYPIWYKGKRVGERVKKEFSDGLAEFYLKYNRPEVYNPAQQFNHNVNVGDLTEHRRTLITKAVLNGLAQGWSLEETIQFLTIRGVPDELLSLVDRTQLPGYNPEDGSITIPAIEVED